MKWMQMFVVFRKLNFFSYEPALYRHLLFFDLYFFSLKPGLQPQASMVCLGKKKQISVTRSRKIDVVDFKVFVGWMNSKRFPSFLIFLLQLLLVWS